MSTDLRSGLIRLAYTNPELRADLLPLLEKHAGEGDMAAVLEAEADPTSHDQNLPEHYYFGKTAEERLENIEKMLSQFASPASKDQNKPQSYYGLPPKGKQASTSKVAANYDPTDGDFNEQEAVRDEIVAALAKKFKGVKDSASLNAFDVGNNHYSLHGEWVAGHDNDLKTRIQVPTRAKYVAAIVKAVVDAEKGGKQASVKTAGGPDSTGRNWKEKNDGGKHRWVWAGQSGDPAFTVSEHEAPFGMYYKLSMLLNDGTMLQTVGQKLKPSDWFKRAAELYKSSQSVMIDFSNMPEKWKRIASTKTAGGSGAANAAFLRQSPLKNKILQAVAKHYGTSVKEIEAELTDPDAEAVFEYIGNDAALQMQVYREFSTFSKNKHAAAKAPAKLKGKKLDDAISKAYYKHGDRVQVDIMNIGKIYAAGKAAYEGAESLEEADKALDEAMKAAIAKYRMN